jgi:hypothetical protein
MYWSLHERMCISISKTTGTHYYRQSRAGHKYKLTVASFAFLRWGEQQLDQQPDGKANAIEWEELTWLEALTGVANGSIFSMDMYHNPC